MVFIPITKVRDMKCSPSVQCSPPRQVRTLAILIIAGLWIPSLCTCSKKAPEPTPPTVQEPTPPPAEPKPLVPDRYSETFYQALVEKNARTAKVPNVDVEALKRPFPYYKEFSGEKTLKVGKKMETDHIRLKVTSEMIQIGEEGMGVKTSHIILTITNRTDKYLAYKVITTPPGKHQNMGIGAHNAIALKPNETIARSESLPPDEEKVSLTINRIEVMEIPPLGYYYISRLNPLRLHYDPRVSAGHELPAGLPQCMIFPWRLLSKLLEAKEVAWYDIIDFYARHDCDKYSYFEGYKRNMSGPERVPARPPE